MLTAIVVGVALGPQALGGGSGISLPASIVTGLASGREAREFLLYWLSLGLVVAVIGLIFALLRSGYGLALTAIRDNENRVKALGYNTAMYKTFAYVVAGTMAGLAGALNANLNSFVSPNALAWTQSGILLAMVILGGVGRLYGAPIGAATRSCSRCWCSRRNSLPGCRPSWVPTSSATTSPHRTRST